MSAETVARTLISIFVGLAIVGITGNTLLVYATVKSKKLRHACNIFVGVISVCSIFHQLSHIVPAYLLYSRVYFIPLAHCIMIQAIPSLCLNTSTFLILTIAIDRLFVIVIPVWYHRIHKAIYTKVMLIPAVIYGLLQLLFAILEARMTPTEPVICLVVTIFSGLSALVFTYIDSAIYILIILVYTIVWCKAKSTSFVRKDKMLKSLAIVAAFSTLNWSISLGTGIIKEKYTLDIMEAFCLDLIAGLTMNVDMTINCFIFYKFSEDYRYALHHALGLLPKKQVKPFYSSALAPINDEYFTTAALEVFWKRMKLTNPWNR